MSNQAPKTTTNRDPSRSADIAAASSQRADDPSSAKSTNLHPDAAPSALAGREVLVCVCGGIAAYKTASLVSALVQRGAGVTVAMTQNAQRFVGPITFRALTGRTVFTDAWEQSGNADIQHLKLAERAHLLIVAPATANILGKLAHGIADELVSALLLGAACPILMAPAMNVRMWNHPATQRNIHFLRESCAVHFVGPDAGWLACRDVGVGRMSEPEEILADALPLLKP